VDGVYTTDHGSESKARKLDRSRSRRCWSWRRWGKVLQTRSVELAMRYKVKLRVLSSFRKQ
jgi:aspartate kinase